MKKYEVVCSIQRYEAAATGVKVTTLEASGTCTIMKFRPYITTKRVNVINETKVILRNQMKMASSVLQSKMPFLLHLILSRQTSAVSDFKAFRSRIDYGLIRTESSLLRAAMASSVLVS